MMKKDDIDPRVISLLEELKPASPRDPRAAARGRAQFLSEAVSAREKQRHSLWTLFLHKEKFAMNLIISTLVVVGLLFGGSATVAAAQDDLPNQPLYQVKLMSENVHLWFVSDPAQQINTLMEQAQNRIQEMEALASQGIVPPAEVAVQAQEQIQRALQIAAQMDEASQQLALQQIQAHLRTQEQQMLQLQQGTCTECEPVLQQTREMLQLRLRELDGSLATPPANQNQNQHQNQNQIQTTQTPQPTEAGTVPNGTCTPALDGTGQQNGGGNTSAATPMQQNNQNNQNQNGTSSGGGGPSTGSGDGSGSPSGSGDGSGSSSGSGGQGGKP